MIVTARRKFKKHDMRNIIKDLKNKVIRVLHHEQEDTGVSQDAFSKNPINPGLEEKQENVGKKVFEKTGQLREGVGQSSTQHLNIQETPAKTNQGIPNRKPYKRNNFSERSPQEDHE
jgi:hypothetical protein